MLKCCGFCTEAIENAEANTFNAGGAPKTGQFFAVICILQFSLISEYLTLGASARVTVLGFSFVRSFIHSFVHSFCPSSYRDHRSLLKLGKGMNRLSTTVACNVTRGFC